MDNNKFEQIVKKVVADHHNRSNDPGLSQITEDDVFIVWSCKTLQNNKCECTEVCNCTPCNPYEATVPLMLSEDYKARFVAEYRQTKIRYVKLKAYCDRIEMAMMHPRKVEMPPHDCDLELLRQQQHYMGCYLGALEKRAIVEGICLD